MTDPFVAEIRMFGFNFAPKGWAKCNGQILPISQNTALFSLLGTFYGGDGKSTFALPDLIDRVPLGPGQGPGLSNYAIGQAAGTEFVTLLESEIPAHNHSLLASNSGADEEGFKSPAGNVPGQMQSSARLYGSGANTVTMNASAIAPTGGGLPHNNLMRYLALNFCIALQGIFPPRKTP